MMNKHFLAAAFALWAGGAAASNGGAFLVAQFAASQGDLDVAATKMMQALRDDPSNAELHGDAFVLALLAERPDAAELARSVPDNQAAQLLLADTAALAGDWKGAELGFAELPHQGLVDTLRPVLLAWAQQAQGLTDRAMDSLQPAILAGHFTPLYLMHAALIADAAHRDGLAKRLYADLAKTQSEPNRELAEILASWQARTGDRAAADATIDTLLRASPELGLAGPAMHAALDHPAPPDAISGIARAYLAVATVVHAQNSSDFASVLVQLALGLQPDFSQARLMASELATDRHLPELAERELSRIPATDRLAPLAQLRRANLLTRLDRHDEAVALLRAMAATYPDRPEPLAALGDTLADEKHFSESVAAYDQAIALIPRPTNADWTLFYARGAALERAHEWPRAEADMNRALELAPDQPFVLNFLGFSLAERNADLPRARDMIVKALTARPNDGAIVDSLGWVTLRLGNTGEALRLLEKAAELEPEDPDITGHLGDAYWAAGRRIEAEDQWRRALVLKPDADERKRIETRLDSASK